MSGRREFLRGSSILLAHGALGAVVQAFASGPRKPSYLTGPELATLRALVDTILPATDSPAASAADTHYFIDAALPACGSPAAQATFRRALGELAGFESLSPVEQIEILSKRANADQPLEYDQSFFRILKDYALTGYFLSEIGATQALAYESVPGGYWGDLPLGPEQKAWAI